MLHNDLESLRGQLVSLALVADPFGEYRLDLLRRCFVDRVLPFKHHYVVDLDRPVGEHVSDHHRRYARKALREVVVERCEEPARYINEWLALHRFLANRHRITGIRAFSADAFAKQLSLPGMVMFRATHAGEAVGAFLAFAQDDVIHGHVGAWNMLGYKVGAPYALFWSAIEHFSRKARWLDLGGVPGITDSCHVGLRMFKRGWTPIVRTAYFCGRIFDHRAYRQLSTSASCQSSKYFPAYRIGEFQ